MGNLEWWATFDCYGTLVDWDGGIFEAVQAVAGDKAGAILEEYHRVEPELEREEPFRSYREVLAETLRQCATRVGVALEPEQEQVLGNTLPDWRVFPDVKAALEGLRREGWKLAILSNVDRDLIARSQRHIGIPIDLVVTAEEVRSYKPAHGHFKTFLEKTGVSKEQVIHVARSYFHDITPVTELGWRNVWVNRGGDVRDEIKATRVIPDLTKLPETLRELRGF